MVLSTDNDDKKNDITTVERVIDPEKRALAASHSSVSDADQLSVIDFAGDAALPPPPVLTKEQEKQLYRKLDMRLMPILALMYLLSFLDRGNIGNAKLQGLTTQLNLVGNQYNIALTMYFVPYCLFECPANLVLKRFRPSRWLPAITIAWGTVMTLMGLVKNYPQLVGVRVCLGVAEAGLFPGVVYYLTLWYPRAMLQFRVGIFFGAASLAGAFSGLLAFGISFMSGTAGLEGWSWIFILEGIATVLVGILALFVMVDFPSTAKFLTPEEKSYVIWKKKYDNSSVGEEERFAPRHIWAAFSDWQVWLHILVYMSVIGPLYGISLFLPTIIKTFGFTDAISNLLTVPPYVFATITLYTFAIWSDHIQKRSPFILAGLCMLLVGFAINIADVPSGVKYFGTFFCVAGSYASFPGVVSWLGNNLAGQYKRGVGMALHIGIGNFAGAIASNVFRTQDSPRYVLGHGIMLMFVGIGFVAAPTVVLLYAHINRKRERVVAAGGGQHSAKELRAMGDRAPDFRYMY
ncbi:MFS general substrate transporter [Artomyces pyxidatus]|uniref:MFS general substrate transporter n=1 Tax=Artomyces pyxidatus TaxID=48021 RepID=A0ACB8SFM4_9AGAM|nr:MFS general substrate transporter [Artomyces pyxidatus]